MGGGTLVWFEIQVNKVEENKDKSAIKWNVLT